MCTSNKYDGSAFMPGMLLVTRESQKLCLGEMIRLRSVQSRLHQFCRLFQRFIIKLHRSWAVKSVIFIELEGWQTPHLCQWRESLVLFIGQFLAKVYLDYGYCYLISGCRNQETREGTYGTAADSKHNKGRLWYMCRAEFDFRLRRHRRYCMPTSDCGLRQPSLPISMGSAEFENNSKHKMSTRGAELPGQFN
jgi:hypothetical protein